MYKAMKIAAGCNNILPTLIHTGFNVIPLLHILIVVVASVWYLTILYSYMQEYLWDVKCNGTYDDYASLYLEIWKRVAKEKV